MNKALDLRMDAYLTARGVDLAYARKAGLRAIDAAEAKGFGFPYPRPGILIPYFDPFSSNASHSLVRIRYFDPPTNAAGKEVKFAQPKGSGVEAYFDPHLDWREISKDATVPIHFVEGEIKALAMNERGIVAIGLGGVDSFGGADLTPRIREVLR
jgi:hypothetical protein